MARNVLAVLALLVLLGGSAPGQIIVSDDFESYANAAALEAQWPLDAGDGRAQLAPPLGPFGLIVPCVAGDPCDPAPFDGTPDPTTSPPIPAPMGQAVSFPTVGGIHEWDDDGNQNTAPFELIPTASKSIHLSADIFNDGNLFAQSAFGRRFSVGLRNDTVLDRDPLTFGNQVGWNFLELGTYNADAIDPTDGVTVIPATDFAYRIALFDGTSIGPPLVQTPDWQYFQLGPEWDDPNFDHNGDGKVGDGDGLSDASDVGPGWHRYSATISETSVSLELDLFRDGTVDASQSWDIRMAEDNTNPGNLAAFSSLRMGGPSGISMNENTMVDNVLLELIDVVSGVTGDFDNNGMWNCDDINALSAAIASGSTNLNFDMNGDGVITPADITDPTDGWLTVGGANNPAQTNGNPFLNGDANLSGAVDGSDFGVWNANKFSNSAAWCNGDFNASGGVDGSDFGIWNGNKFQSSASASAVPEPAIGTAFAVLLLAGGLCRRREGT